MHVKARTSLGGLESPASGPSDAGLISHLRDSVLRHRIGVHSSCNPVAPSSEQAHRSIFERCDDGQSTRITRDDSPGWCRTIFGLWPRHRAAKAAQATAFPVMHTDAEWRSLLSPAAYNVLRRQGTEIPFSSKLDFETRAGTYACAGCDLPVFSSATKYDSHTGWPSFWQPLAHAVARGMIQASGWPVPRFTASVAVDILVMCSAMARRPPVFAIA